MGDANNFQQNAHVKRPTPYCSSIYSIKSRLVGIIWFEITTRNVLLGSEGSKSVKEFIRQNIAHMIEVVPRRCCSTIVTLRAYNSFSANPRASSTCEAPLEWYS